MVFTAEPQHVEAGFPSPATDHAEGSLDLAGLVVRRPAATFYWRVVGSSMADAGIADGDLLVVDRSIKPKAEDVVVAVVDGGFACKRVRRRGAGWVLASDGDGPTIRIDPEQGIEVWGVVTWSFREHRRR
jgi:DNA polymerase V